MTARRLYAPVVLALLALGGLALLASSRTWLRAPVETPGLPSDTVLVSGRDAAPAAFGLAIVVIAAALAVLATAGLVRRGVGLLVVVTSVAGAMIAQSAEPAAEALTKALAESPAFTGSDNGGELEHTAWQLVTVVAFVGAALLGLAVIALARRWPTMGARYESPAAKSEVSEGDLWSALDEGRDPTE